METTIVYWGNMGIMENKMESTIIGYNFGVITLSMFSAFMRAVRM